MHQLEDILACPIDHSPLRRQGDKWVSQTGRIYPSIQGIPILFNPQASDTLKAMAETRRIAEGQYATEDPYLIDTLGMSEDQKSAVRNQLTQGDYEVDPVISHMVAATCGNLYLSNVGKLRRYPIPDFRWKNGEGRLMLDMGCNWGRWCVAAAREGFVPVGIDPQIGALLAAQRLCKQLHIKAHFVCGDARHLPFRNEALDLVFSYSVLQHLSRPDVNIVVDEVRRVLSSVGEAIVQMPHRYGPRCFYQWARRRFTDGDGFQVRYWTRKQLIDAFQRIGQVKLTTEGYLGIGLQPADKNLLPTTYQLIISVSEALRKTEQIVFPLRSFADSLYVHARKVS